jgi:hypothetical protein
MGWDSFVAFLGTYWTWRGRLFWFFASLHGGQCTSEQALRMLLGYNGSLMDDHDYEFG